MTTEPNESTEPTAPDHTDPVPDPFAVPVPEPAEDLVAPEHVREVDRGDGPEADLVVTDADSERVEPRTPDGWPEADEPLEGI